MNPTLEYECTRVPVTTVSTVSTCIGLLVVAEGPFLRITTGALRSHLYSTQVFKSQTIHGILVLRESEDDATLLAWGGVLITAITLHFKRDAFDAQPKVEAAWLSDIIKAPDWLLDIRPSSEEDLNLTVSTRKCAAVTAHNALLELSIQTRCRSGRHNPDDQRGLSTSHSGNSHHFTRVTITELTPASRSILYSAHLLWETKDCILVAAGTAFGEVLYWSWTRAPATGQPHSEVHRVLLGHEGSVFGVHISDEWSIARYADKRRFLASCSDDRTVRVWDVSTNTTGDDQHNNRIVPLNNLDDELHTGFINEAFDEGVSSSVPLAIGWGHLSRIWKVRYLTSESASPRLLLLSAGEDATARLWQLDLENPLVVPSHRSSQLTQLDMVSCHSGKSIWDTDIYAVHTGSSQQVVTVGADSKIVITSLLGFLPSAVNHSYSATRITLEEVIVIPKHHSSDSTPDLPLVPFKSSTSSDFFRDYAFVDEETFIMTTNLGRVYLGILSLTAKSGSPTVSWQQIGLYPDLAGYSICVGNSKEGIAWLAGAHGQIYVFDKRTSQIKHVYTAGGKVSDISDTGGFTLISLAGQRLVEIVWAFQMSHDSSKLSCHGKILTEDWECSSIITSMEYWNDLDWHCIVLGSRQGSIALYRFSVEEAADDPVTYRSPQILHHVHGKEAITCLKWITSRSTIGVGSLISAGRDGCICIHRINSETGRIMLIHSLGLPAGPSIEGICFQSERLMAYGYANKDFVMFDSSTEEQIMNVQTGGAHRNWALQVRSGWFGSKETDGYGRATLIWTRALNMHVYHQDHPRQITVRSGTHGREIKAVAMASADPAIGRQQMIATGAEDTDIKIFRYDASELTCQRTLRKHKTGIQDLQWSKDGRRLFSSGGCEEFYVWRVREISAYLGGVGVVSESVLEPESEQVDLRIMSFDVHEEGADIVVAMVFSNSTLGVYSYNPGATKKWHKLARGVYFTSCLTQCVLLSRTNVLTAGTDGHTVLWDLPEASPEDSGDSMSIKWRQPRRLHQSTSKSLATQVVTGHRQDATLIVSGGDDGSIAFLLASRTILHPLTSAAKQWPRIIGSQDDDLLAGSASSSSSSVTLSSPTIILNAHASAVTACAVVHLPTTESSQCSSSSFCVFTAGTDQWFRAWHVTLLPLSSTVQPQQQSDIHDDGSAGSPTHEQPAIEVKKLSRWRTHVADVSSMVILSVSHSSGRSSPPTVPGSASTAHVTEQDDARREQDVEKKIVGDVTHQMLKTTVQERESGTGDEEHSHSTASEKDAAGVRMTVRLLICGVGMQVLLVHL